MARTQKQVLVALACYGLLLLITSCTIGTTLYRYPLFPLQTDNLTWSNAWLATTVVDYYGAALCFCGVILHTEQTWTAALIWSAGCCLLGSPVCCLYVLYKLYGGHTLRLEPSRGGESLDPLVD